MQPTAAQQSCTAIVNEMSAAAVQDILELAQKATIEIVNPPESGLIMMHVLDAFDSEFLLGEALVTKAEVKWGDCHGFAMVTGDQPERCLARACAEVLLEGDDDLLRTRLQKLLLAEQKRLDERRRREASQVAATKVSFDLMPGN